MQKLYELLKIKSTIKWKKVETDGIDTQIIKPNDLSEQ